MSIIQQINKFEPLTINFTVKRKNGPALTPYSFPISLPEGGTVSSGEFENAYLVPIYNSANPDATTIEFNTTFSGTYSENYPVQCEWNFGDGSKTMILDRQMNIDALNNGEYDPVYHRFLYGGPSGTATIRRVTFTAVDLVGRKTALSVMLYPKSGA